MILIIVGIVIILISGILIFRIVNRMGDVSIIDFDKKFEYETTVNPAKFEMASKRKEMAKDLNIHPDFEIKNTTKYTTNHDENNLDTIETEKLA